MKLYCVNKRKNSTKLPTVSELVVECEVVLKKPTSLRNPTFTLTLTDEIANKINYCEYENKYYWITDIVRMSNKQVQIDCSIDVLASYKEEILQNKCLVEYADAGDSGLYDDRRSYKPDIEFIQLDRKTLDHITSMDSGAPFYYYINISGGTSTDTYVLNQTQMQGFVNELATPNLGESIINTILKPEGRIISIKMSRLSPTAFSNYATSNDSLSIHGVSFNTGGYTRVLTQKSKIQFSLTIDWNLIPRDSNLTTVGLYIPFVGNIDLDVSSTYPLSEITFKYIIDTDCNYYLRIGNNTGRILQEITGSFAVPIAITKEDARNMLMLGCAAVTAIIGAVITKNPKTASTAKSLFMSAGATAGVGITTGFEHTTRGSNDAKTSIYCDRDIILYALTMIRLDSNEIFGYPYHQVRYLASLKGYVETNKASVSVKADLPTIDEINNILDGGCYIE